MIPETQAETLADRDMWAHRALTAEQRATEYAAALEAAKKEVDSAHATSEHLHEEDTREIVALTQERDAALAALAKAEAKLAIARRYVEELMTAADHLEAFHRVALLAILDHDAAPSGAAS